MGGYVFDVTINKSWLKFTKDGHTKTLQSCTVNLKKQGRNRKLLIVTMDYKYFM